MTHFRFGIRDLLWAMVVLALCLGWFVDSRIPSMPERIREFRGEAMENALLEEGWKTEQVNMRVRLERPDGRVYEYDAADPRMFPRSPKHY